MIVRILLATVILTVTWPARAAWDVGGGLEDFQWTEYPEGFNGNPRETGKRAALFIHWTQEGGQGPLFAWRAKLYGGTVNYDTFLVSTGAPVSTKTDYGGAASEGLLATRWQQGPAPVEAQLAVRLQAEDAELRHHAAARHGRRTPRRTCDEVLGQQCHQVLREGTREAGVERLAPAQELVDPQLAGRRPGDELRAVEMAGEPDGHHADEATPGVGRGNGCGRRLGNRAQHEEAGFGRALQRDAPHAEDQSGGE